MLHQGNYGPSTGEALHTLAGELTRFVGSLAFETGRQAETRYWWLEAAHRATHLGELAIAERSSRTALATVRPEYPRTRTSYLAGRAEVLVRQRNIEEAVSTATQAVVAASEISSSRIDARIGRVRVELARYSDQPTVAKFLDWSAEILPTKTNTSADPR